MEKIVIGLSGGMDSATLLGSLLDKGWEVHCCSFYYGSKHGVWENRAAENIIEYYMHYHNKPIYAHTIDLRKAFLDFKSNLLLSGGEIPEGHYESENMVQTVVPGRNLIFASVMAGLAESIGAKLIALGVHSGDHHIYPDCRPTFINYLSQTIKASTDGKVNVIAPFLDLDKAKILKIGFNLNPPVPYKLTRTCYKDQPISCGKCGSCQERLEAFNIIGRIDSITYKTD